MPMKYTPRAEGLGKKATGAQVPRKQLVIGGIHHFRRNQPQDFREAGRRVFFPLRAPPSPSLAVPIPAD
ncbi:hypothetical protein BABINDRAFT_162498 [Babjeviella inositovora NRRL Y-12698]|uniref:Uncharacterized protein n=1 Tax=Babjeviella inositovora NRRL Y-12698 TaxID=984486 RepID=A0A1E3QMA4_9ASCO|nr:uncharacterized protein BABINDRAFT_162498 [Babjeviella inositovora NRRL Y-12698]ODQ78815.1 hypothetical protein BABINDRAFT_162498 [Babjeviella inositovora NRRL Y-12698]